MMIKRHPERTIAILMVFLLLILLIGSYTFWKNNYESRVYPGITLGSLNLGKQSFTEIKKNIANRATQIEGQGITFKHEDKEIILESVVSSFDSDLSYPALLFNLSETVDKAFDNKSKQTFWEYLRHLLKTDEQKRIVAVYTLDEERIKKTLNENFPELLVSTINASFSIIDTADGEIQLKTNSERIGKEIDYDKILEELHDNLDNLENKTITIKTRTKYPEVKESDLVVLEDKAQKVINQGVLFLKYKDEEWGIKPSDLISWFSTERINNQLELALDPKQINNYLEEEIAPKINKEVIRPKFEIENDKVTSWITGIDGRKLKIQESSKKINNEMLSGSRVIDLVVEELTNDTYIPEQGFQIKEIIGTGHSNFAGSPSNRRHNIQTGADAVHGVLVKPDEEFSLIKTLGEIDAGSGYLPELVIKGNETIPEYGGGLCQIATTVFRSALQSGLPITARRSHSYRVSYYEPAGTDASVYDPWPDIRFINDTGNYILIQARIKNKNDLYFDFWGVKDGRTIALSPPVISNIVKPEPTKLIETTALPPGEKKCTESSHNGADAYFNYTVVYPEGATTTPTQEVRFNSHYVPWQEVCLIGVATTTPTTTEEIIKETIE